MDDKDSARLIYQKKQKGKNKKKKKFVYRSCEGYRRERFDWRRYEENLYN